MKVVVILFALLPIMVQAQVPSAPAATDVTIDVPVSSCTPPNMPPRIQPSSEALDRFNKELGAYRQCVERYVQSRSEDMKHANAVARANADAANASVQQLNDFMKQLQDRAAN